VPFLVPEIKKMKKTMKLKYDMEKKMFMCYVANL